MYTAVCGVYVPRNGAGSSKTSEVGAEDSSGSEFKGRGMECSQGKRGMCSVWSPFQWGEWFGMGTRELLSLFCVRR
ncbi:hypothetical protein GBAR_LOCUS26720 [Geodia barretti]|uniref:Uncharacterized protein n=1 Tax=Geodia barretti TaxID=519541 RepID=A0AA35THK6_GEOBA|nr:hypothetical protein GBAR_LOCUS26720 [Geodia barretti]